MILLSDLTLVLLSPSVSCHFSEEECCSSASAAFLILLSLLLMLLCLIQMQLKYCSDTE